MADSSKTTEPGTALPLLCLPTGARIFSRSSKTVVYLSVVQLPFDTLPRLHVLKVPKDHSEAFTEASALKLLEGVAGVVPFRGSFRLDRAQDPFAASATSLRFDGWCAEECVVLAMPLVESSSPLSTFRDDETAFKRIVASILRVLGDCHRRGVAHGDVRSANILINKQTSCVTLIDFGLATIEQPLSRLLRTLDYRQLALVVLAALCQIRYSSSEYQTILMFDFTRGDLEYLLYRNVHCKSMTQWQVDMVELAAKWITDYGCLSAVPMYHEMKALPTTTTMPTTDDAKPRVLHSKPVNNTLEAAAVITSAKPYAMHNKVTRALRHCENNSPVLMNR